MVQTPVALHFKSDKNQRMRVHGKWEISLDAGVV
jgi:hypothetical protein